MRSKLSIHTSHIVSPKLNPKRLFGNTIKKRTLPTVSPSCYQLWFLAHQFSLWKVWKRWTTRLILFILCLMARMKSRHLLRFLAMFVPFRFLDPALDCRVREHFKKSATQLESTKGLIVKLLKESSNMYQKSCYSFRAVCWCIKEWHNNKLWSRVSTTFISFTLVHSSMLMVTDWCSWPSTGSCEESYHTCGVQPALHCWRCALQHPTRCKCAQNCPRGEGAPTERQWGGYTNC